MLGLPWWSNGYDLPSNAGGVGLIHHQGAKTLHASPHCSPKKKEHKQKKQYFFFLNLDWHLVSYMTFHMFQCHSSKSSHPLPQSP